MIGQINGASISVGLFAGYLFLVNRVPFKSICVINVDLKETKLSNC